MKAQSIQVPTSHYFRPQYDHRYRFLCYWHQINDIWSLSPDKVLEIGIGNAFLSNYLKERGVNVVTFDLDAYLRPDCAGNLLQTPFLDGAFDVVACYEVLEHLPFELLPTALSELARISRRYITFSVPNQTPAYRINIQLPRVGEIIKKLLVIPRLNPLKHEFDGQHYWEMGKADYPEQRIRNTLAEAGFEIIKSYRLYEEPKYHFFVLRKY